LSTWKRGFLEILAEMLTCIKEGNNQKTRICSKCKLDSRVVKKYLRLLESMNLVRPFNGDMTSYVITEKGLKYLDKFNSFIEMIEKDLTQLPSSQLANIR
jgi:predicted transcriptional regulator